MKNVLRFGVAASVVFLLCAMTAIVAPAQTFSDFFIFDQTDGESPGYGSLVQGFDGNFYGTTVSGGVYNAGTIFRISPTGTLTSLYSFCASCGYDGYWPFGGLVQGADGNLYGTTGDGGTSNAGIFFKITPTGTLTTLLSFDPYYGSTPYGDLVQANDGNFYGVTVHGGNAGLGYGTVFKVTSTGTLTTLHNFDQSDGEGPEAGLIQGTDGNFYGTTGAGGLDGYGTVFRITPSGTLTTMHNFSGADGSTPQARLVQASDGNFYGTTGTGGGSTNCSYGCGTVFRISARGVLTTLHTFDSTDGSYPGALLQTANGNFYGTTAYGGESGYGTVFKVTSGGTLTTLHNFDLTDGGWVFGELYQATNGTFYGTTYVGGDTGYCPYIGCGTIFSLSVGLGPFVRVLPSVGKVGSSVAIVGNGLAGTTSVTFNGTPATFTVVSPTEIKTTVPTGATSGKVQVTTPHGTLTSNVVFRVR